MTDAPDTPLPDAPLPPRGMVARVDLAGFVETLQRSAANEGGVFVARDGSLIVSAAADGGVRLRFATAEDAARLALALLSVAAAMEEDAHRAGAAAAAALDRITTTHEAGHA